MIRKELEVKDINKSKLCGHNNINLSIIQEFIDVEIKINDNKFIIESETEYSVDITYNIILKLISILKNKKKHISKEELHNIISTTSNYKETEIHSNSKNIFAKTPAQKELVEAFEHNDIIFSIGRAGTGKTLTSILLAVKALQNKNVQKIFLTRPVVEAGEHLGALPGTITEKLDPYMLPLYDSLSLLLPKTKLKKYLEDKTIEIAPVAFVRGRTFTDAIVICDESQNLTSAQMLLFLTRLGKNSKMLFTGDLSQIDLSKHVVSGLSKAKDILQDIDKIKFIEFKSEDNMRHPLINTIIERFENDKT